MKNTQFERYVDLIRKRAHEYSTKYGIDYSEMESQGFLIFCECLETFDCAKAKFSTHLYIQLNRLNDYAKTYKRQKGVFLQDYFSPEAETPDYDEILVSKNYDLPEIKDFLTEAKKELSSEAFNVLVWIVKRDWEEKSRRKPTISMAVKHFNSTRQVIEKVWEECRKFWLNYGLAFYA